MSEILKKIPGLPSYPEEEEEFILYMGEELKKELNKDCCRNCLYWSVASDFFKLNKRVCYKTTTSHKSSITDSEDVCEEFIPSIEHNKIKDRFEILDIR